MLPFVSLWFPCAFNIQKSDNHSKKHGFTYEGHLIAIAVQDNARWAWMPRSGISLKDSGPAGLGIFAECYLSSVALPSTDGELISFDMWSGLLFSQVPFC